MVATQNAQSLADFQQTGAETLDRLNRTGQAEMLTVDGEVRALLMSPTEYQAYRDAQEFTDEDGATVHLSIQQFRAGQGRPVDEVFAGLRAKLLAGELGPVDGAAK